MATSSLWPFQCPSAHEAVSDIIRRHSTNACDVRQVALRDLDLSFAKSVLDLGCGFGFMSEVLAQRTARDARVLGVDAWPANEAPFLDRIAGTGRRGAFTCMEIGTKLPWPDRTFDVVVCCYSLYFFVSVLPEVARVLARGGVFLAVTHSERSVRSVRRAAGAAEAGRESYSSALAFSSENGAGLLERHFDEVTRIDYRNALRFAPRDLDDLLTYLRFKLPLLTPDSRPGCGLPEAYGDYARALLLRTGRVRILKNDTVFHCRSPLCH